MLEVLDYLRANGFRTYIVSGGGIEFVRRSRNSATASAGAGDRLQHPTRYEVATACRRSSGCPRSISSTTRRQAGRHPEVHRKRPIAVFGNSDGDFEMLEWVTPAPAAAGVIVHHDDGVREFAYDARRTSVG